jgi:hypothetical protein
VVSRRHSRTGQGGRGNGLFDPKAVETFQCGKTYLCKDLVDPRRPRGTPHGRRTVAGGRAGGRGLVSVLCT